MRKRRWMILGGIAAAVGMFFLSILGYFGIIKRPIKNLNKQKVNGIKVACVGDSITYGLGVEGWAKNQYPQVLQRLFGDGYKVVNFGVSRTTAMASGDIPYVKQTQYEQSLSYQPDIVVLMFGTNDSKTNNWQGKEEFKTQYKELVDSYFNLDSSPNMYLCTPAMPYVLSEGKGELYFDMQSQVVAEVADIVKEVAAEQMLPCIDIRKATSNHPEWFKIDGIHPNAEGALHIAETIHMAIKE